MQTWGVVRKLPRPLLPASLAIIAGIAVIAGLALPAEAAEPVQTFPYPRELPEVTAAKLPRWRGFNLQYKFHRDWANTPIPDTPDNVAEQDFRMIAELGFNFVRIPMDYRIWIRNGDWEQFDDAALQEIDRIVALGEKYGIHVCLNFHRAPGYTVNTPREPTDLWSDTETQRVCALHWATFARRYKGIPSRRLSFNLFNEPADIDADVHFAVVTKMVEAIRAEDPDRLIIADGLDFGKVPELRMRELGIAEATRGYSPFGLTHFGASWVSGADTWPTPEWPASQLAGFFAGPQKPDLQDPLVIEGPLGGKQVTVTVGQVSSHSRLVVKTNGGDTIWDRSWTPSANDPEAAQIIYADQWDIYQNIYNRDYTFTVPAGVSSIEFLNTEGDWMKLVRVTIGEGADAHSLSLVQDYGGRRTGRVTFAPGDPGKPFRGFRAQDRTWLWLEVGRHWRRLPHLGIGVMVGEFGCYNKTPHAVALRWMEDFLEICRRARMGWALWEFRGSFGILDSGRSDVAYETWNGHQLDREMLELLQRY